MGLRLPLDLLDLDQRLIAHPVFRVGPVDRPPVEVDLGRIHAPIREVGVMRDRQQLVARLALAVHPCPQVGRVGRIERAERHRRHMRAILEEDVAVEVHVVRHGRPLIAAEGGELAGFVGLVREFDVLFPDRVRDLGTHQRLDRRATEQVGAVEVDSLNLFRAVVLEDQRLRGRQLADRRTGIIGQLHHADIFGVIGDAGEIERRIDLDVVAERMLDRLALEILVGIAGIGHPIAEQPGIERPAGVNVGLAEIRVAKRVALGERW